MGSIARNNNSNQVLVLLQGFLRFRMVRRVDELSTSHRRPRTSTKLELIFSPTWLIWQPWNNNNMDNSSHLPVGTPEWALQRQKVRVSAKSLARL